MRNIHFVALSITIFSLCYGCSVGMAISGNNPKDLSVFYIGAERSFVHAKAGPPEIEVQDKDGLWIDTYLIVKGNEPSVGRAAAHGVMDVLTIGLWEVIGTPMELVEELDEYKNRFEIYYDKGNKIQRMERIYGETEPVDEDSNLKKNQPYPIDHTK